MDSSHQVHCLACPNRLNTEWSQLCTEDLQLLSQARVLTRYKAGQTIFHQGSPPLGLYCVSSGLVILRKTDSQGRSAIVRMVGRGEVLGYRAYFSDQRYSATAEASSDCTVCWIERAAVQRLVQKNPALLMAFLTHASKDLLEAENTTLRVTTQSVRSRMAHLLLTLKDRDGNVDESGQIYFSLQLSRQDIASLLGTTPETVARVTRQLTTDGVAIFERRQVMIPDLDRLLDEVELSA